MSKLTSKEEAARKALGISEEEYLEILSRRAEKDSEAELLESLQGEITHVWDRDYPPRKEGESCSVNNGFESLPGILVRMIQHGEREAAVIRLGQWDKEIIAHHPDNAW